MKRNEMLDLMADTYIKYATHSYTTRDRMVFVLKEMEKAGMLPPEVKKVTKPFNWLEGVHEWEPEDESN